MKRRLISTSCWMIGAIAGVLLESIAFRAAGVSGIMAIVAFVVADAYRIRIWNFQSSFVTKPLSIAFLFLFLGPLVAPF